MDAWLRQVLQFCFTIASHVSMSKQLFLQGAPVVQRCYCRGELGLVVARYGCRVAVLQTEQYSGVGLFCSSSGVGLSAAVAGWGCFAVAIRRNAADTGNDYNYRLEVEERRDGAVSRVVCSVLFFVLLRHVMLLCPRDIN